MRKKKILSLLLAATMTVTAFTGCGNNNADETSATGANDSKPSNDYTVSMLYSDNAGYPYKKDWKVLDYIKEGCGATLKIQAVPESDYDTKRDLILTSGNIPDIVSKTFPKQKDVFAGLYLPVSKYEDKLPNFKKFIDDNNLRDELNNTRFSDGNYYGLPVKLHSTRLQDQQWLVRKDIFEKNNIKIPTTLDELYDAGKKLKEIYPDSTPITNRFTADNIMTGFAGAFGTIAGWTAGEGFPYYNEAEDKWEFSATTDKWKNMLTYVNKLYKDGILDKEFSTLDSTVYEQRITQGKTFIMYDWTGNIKRYNEAGVENDKDYEVTPIFPIKGTDNNYALSWHASWGQCMVLPATLEKDEKHLNEVLKYIDWCYSDEACQLLTFGEDGNQSTIDKDGIHRWNGTTDWAAQDGLDNNAFCMREDEDFLYSALSKEQTDLFKQIADAGCVAKPNPASPLTPEQSAQIEIYNADVNDYVKESMEQFIFGKRPLSDWDKYVKECEGKGSNKIIDLYNEAWKNRTK